MLTKLQTPIEKLDAFLCAGLDYVESKVPGLKLRPDEVCIVFEWKQMFTNAEIDGMKHVTLKENLFQ
jgi:hypothetical protein